MPRAKCKCLLNSLSHSCLVKCGTEACSDPVPFVSVIGRGGEQISRIQAESGCKIQIASGKPSFFIDLSSVEISTLPRFLDHYLCSLLRSLGARVSICNCCLPCACRAGLPDETQKSWAKAGPETRPPASASGGGPPPALWLRVAPARHLLP